MNPDPEDFDSIEIQWFDIITLHEKISLQGIKGGCLLSLKTGSPQSWQRNDYGKNQGHIATSSIMAVCSYSASQWHFSVWAQNIGDVVFPWILIHMWMYFKLLAVMLKWCWASDLLNLCWPSQHGKGCTEFQISLEFVLELSFQRKQQLHYCCLWKPL